MTSLLFKSTSAYSLVVQKIWQNIQAVSEKVSDIANSENDKEPSSNPNGQKGGENA